jgi:cellulose biosynthesis protein BcsQ
MIQTNIPIVFGQRDERLGIVKIEVRLEDDTQLDGNRYLVVDWDLNNTADAFFSKKVFWSNEQIDQMNDYLDANYDFSGLSKKEVDYLKLVLALMIDTKTNLLPSGKTIYRQTPDVWEFSPELIARFPILATV